MQSAPVKTASKAGTNRLVRERARPHRAERGAAGRGGADDGQQHGGRAHRVRLPLPSVVWLPRGVEVERVGRRGSGRRFGELVGLEARESGLALARVSRRGSVWRRSGLIRDEWSRSDFAGIARIGVQRFGVWCGSSASRSRRWPPVPALRAPHILRAVHGSCHPMMPQPRTSATWTGLVG